MFDKNQLPDITEREAALALHKAWAELADKSYELWQNDADPESVRLADAKRDEAEAALEASGMTLETGEDGNAVRCVVSGAPIVEGDETLFDYSTGEHVLRAAIGLPPRPSEEEALEAAE
jgi:hypothetical protein